MSPIPPPGIGGAITGLSSFISAITVSVVSSMPAIEAAFSRATRATLVGSITPVVCRFSYVSVLALNPKSSFPSRIFWTITLPSKPAFSTICLRGSSTACELFQRPFFRLHFLFYFFNAINSSNVCYASSRNNSFFNCRAGCV